MGGGPPCFPQGSSCPAVLWAPLSPFLPSPTGPSPSSAALSSTFGWLSGSFLTRARNPGVHRTPVWAPSRSLAATWEIDLSFFSSPYLDVSVQAVPPARLCIHRAVAGGFPAGFPHSDIRGSYRIFAPDRGFSQLITSFFGSQCQGIRPAPLLAWPGLPACGYAACSLRA